MSRPFVIEVRCSCGQMVYADDAGGLYLIPWHAVGPATPEQPCGHARAYAPSYMVNEALERANAKRAERSTGTKQLAAGGGQ